MDCESYEANVFEVIDLISVDYPRGGIAMPGLTAGTCLLGTSPSPRSARTPPACSLAVSRVNEGVPLFLVEGIKRRIGTLSSRKVAVLGLTFKRDTDDERDSLSPSSSACSSASSRLSCDAAAMSSITLDGPLRDADVVIVATNHSQFSCCATSRVGLRGTAC